MSTFSAIDGPINVMQTQNLRFTSPLGCNFKLVGVCYDANALYRTSEIYINLRKYCFYVLRARLHAHANYALGV